MNKKSLFILLASLLALTACSATKTKSAPREPQKTKIVKEKVVSKKDVKSKSLSKKVTTKKEPLKKKKSDAKENFILEKADAKARVKGGAILFDARDADVFEAGHLDSAINVPYALLEPTLPALESYKDKNILLVGKNSDQVKAMREAMLKAGFKKVFDAQSLTP